tara:strand:- start:211 stop:465 length:255 start_codon:yes stop_codon:yes gene_type:complete
MKKLFLNFVFVVFFTSNSFSNEVIDCSGYSKFSKDYLKCKTENFKKKTISAGKKIVKDTKNYQKNEWSEEKKKLKNAKDSILKD